ncbi:twin-arginine translocation signal domain-containing protein [Halogeometricum borinquense]|uniref:Twin-arginine translocation signal domain-containing protein n=1 Tax=Halogeometricum borinquense TaxID=60847 RepID=A0A6C0UHT0_9EURY|nr:SCO family protein [Halogeometricum borinquense]QIB73841.1 twin-arginine translocation signal domain-containing protein [Halogeometricum borinquense]QIQ76797.1 twin-arginine translocation signal domain-containing protein [Halogeometricum borinquense]
MNRRSFLRAAGVTGAAGLAGCLGGSPLGSGDSNPNVVLSEPDRDKQLESEDLPYPAWGQRVPDVTIPAPLSDEDVSVRDIEGPHFHTFFFTNCMTVCPLLISSLRKVQVHSINEGYDDEVSFYPISFDPARDDAEAFRKEAKQMNIDMDAGNWHFLRPDGKSEARRIVDETFGVFFEKQENGDKPYMFAHTSVVLLVNGDGYVERAYRGTNPDEQKLIEDLRRVRNASE